MGRHSTFNPELAAKICERLAAGESLLSICRDDGMPPESTVRLWERDNEAFAADSQRAREHGCHRMAEECLQIADEPMPCTQFGTTDSGAVQHARLRIDTRMRLIGKWLPKVYGDKQQVEHSGTVNLAERIVAARKRS